MASRLNYRKIPFLKWSNASHFTWFNLIILEQKFECRLRTKLVVFKVILIGVAGDGLSCALSGSKGTLHTFCTQVMSSGFGLSQTLVQTLLLILVQC